MGADMYMTGSDSTLNLKMHCHTVNEWCSKFWVDERPMDEWLGCFQIPSHAVRKADNEIPHTLSMAIDAGFSSSYPSFDEREFQVCRKFIDEAAKLNSDIEGSY